jgi:hypothetical protein
VALVAQRRGSTGTRYLPLVATIAASLAVVVLPFFLSRVLWYGSDWGWAPFWFCLVACVGQGVAHRRFDVAALTVLSAAWMASLSVGAPYPNLVAGSLTLLTLIRLWESAPLPRVSPLVVRAGAGLAAAAVLGVVLIARTVSVYRDLPAAQLTADLTGVSPALAGVVTNPTTAAYLAQIQTCVARYPASRVAILPGGAGAYAALGLHPALPIDWLWPPDYKGSAGTQAMILAGAAELRRDGDVLVLWQTFDPGHLPPPATLPRATLSSPPFDYDPGFSRRIRAAIGHSTTPAAVSSCATSRAGLAAPRSAGTVQPDAPRPSPLASEPTCLRRRQPPARLSAMMARSIVSSAPAFSGRSR